MYIEPSTLRAELQSASSSNFRMNLNENEAVQVFSANNASLSDTYPYFEFPDDYLGNQLKSYGGYIKYTVRYEGEGDPILFTPDIVLIVRDLI